MALVRVGLRRLRLGVVLLDVLGLLLSPVYLVLKPIGLVGVLSVDRFDHWLVGRTLAKEERTGKTWAERHPRIDALLEKDARVCSLIVASPLLVIFVVFFAVFDPWGILSFLGTFTAIMVLSNFLLERKTRKRSSSLVAAVRSLKDKTCPRVEVER